MDLNTVGNVNRNVSGPSSQGGKVIYKYQGKELLYDKKDTAHITGFKDTKDPTGKIIPLRIFDSSSNEYSYPTVSEAKEMVSNYTPKNLVSGMLVKEKDSGKKIPSDREYAEKKEKIKKLLQDVNNLTPTEATNTPNEATSTQKTKESPKETATVTTQETKETPKNESTKAKDQPSPGVKPSKPKSKPIVKPRTTLKSKSKTTAKSPNEAKSINELPDRQTTTKRVVHSSEKNQGVVISHKSIPHANKKTVISNIPKEMHDLGDEVVILKKPQNPLVKGKEKIIQAELVSSTKRPISTPIIYDKNKKIIGFSYNGNFIPFKKSSEELSKLTPEQAKALIAQHLKEERDKFKKLNPEKKK